ncbi:tetratricopeptide repeat protein [Arenibacterium halophilum]|uniref:Sel1 repeat family protein n=1 Tax=Arenibacterium halophilum TaxID=2583821 RepID=A0ABY2XC32_9RHOB|nr:tetratricopeptide repeat protein [Arenibacterium halophilum]TMV13598.1 sel1 repeat family protein [Arenibacterium halophilum]
MMRYIALALLLLAQLANGAAPARAQDGAAPVEAGPDAAQQLFDQKDYAGAARLWQIAAARGSSQAKLALGLMADQGLGQPRDHARAFQWYLDAGSDGLAEAQFNVGVMLDSGIGVSRDSRAALVWYTRAALRGHARAQYNTALMLAADDPANGSGKTTGSADPKAARYWFSRAATLPASQAQLARLDGATATVVGDRPDVIFQAQSAGRIELVWSGAGAARYGVEVVAIPDAAQGYAEPLALVVTPGTGAIADYTAPDPQVLWRVLAFDDSGTDYTAAPWQGRAGTTLPRGRVRIAAPPIPEAAAFVGLLAEDLRRAGYWVRPGTVSASGSVTGTEIGYSYAADKALAARVASTLPSSAGIRLRQLENGSTLPGEIIVALSSGGDETQ